MSFRGTVPSVSLLVLTAALASWGCGGSASVAETTYDDPHPRPEDAMVVATEEIGTYGGRFVIGQTNDPRTFNHIMANETSSTDVTQRLFASLANFDNGTQESYPSLAKSWEVSEDGRSWTFHMRRGARFSDGHPITSADVLFCFKVAYDDELAPSVQQLIEIDGEAFEVAAPDSYTVVITSKRPYALMLPAVGSLYILPKHILEPKYEAGDFASAFGVNTPPSELVTSGPWTLKEYRPGEKTVLTRNPYWLGFDEAGNRLPYLDELVFLIVPDQNTAALKFQAGELDAVDNVKPEDYKTFEEGQERGNYTLYDIGPALNTNFFWFNLNKKREGAEAGQPYVGATKYAWYSKKEFRQAVSQAIDREAMIRGPFYGYGVKNWSQMTAGNKVWYNADLDPYDYDPEAAKQKLDALGYVDRDGDGFREDENGNKVSIALRTNSDNAVRIALCNLIADDLEQVGIDATLTPVDFNTLISNLRSDFQYDVILLGLQSGVPPDPGMGQNVWRSSGLTHFWNIKQPSPETPAEARIDELITTNVETTDMALRKKTWAEVEEILMEESFAIWLPTLIAKVPIRNKFGNLQPTVIPHRIIWNAERIFVKSRGRA